MKHFIIVLSIILFVLLTFFSPTLIEDASFNDYQYVHDFRRTSHARDDDHPGDGWQKDGTYVPIHMIKEVRPDGSEKIINEDDGYKDHHIDRVSDDRLRDDRDRSNRKNENENENENENKSKTETNANIFPYLLILLLVVLILAVKYNYHSDLNKNLINEQK